VFIFSFCFGTRARTSLRVGVAWFNIEVIYYCVHEPSQPWSETVSTSTVNLLCVHRGTGRELGAHAGGRGSPFHCLTSARRAAQSRIRAYHPHQHELNGCSACGQRGSSFPGIPGQVHSMCKSAVLYIHYATVYQCMFQTLSPQGRLFLSDVLGMRNIRVSSNSRPRGIFVRCP
jgi:hypothetical protein